MYPEVFTSRQIGLDHHSALVTPVISFACSSKPSSSSNLACIKPSEGATLGLLYRSKQESLNESPVHQGSTPSSPNNSIKLSENKPRHGGMNTKGFSINSLLDKDNLRQISSALSTSCSVTSISETPTTTTTTAARPDRLDTQLGTLSNHRLLLSNIGEYHYHAKFSGSVLR